MLALPPDHRLYFAYGSNLHPAQMATRCPASLFLGHATLPNYRWHINQRGVANLLPAPGVAVEGLLYAITPPDEPRLDRSEGVASRLYDKLDLTVSLRPHETFAGWPTGDVAARLPPFEGDLVAAASFSGEENNSDEAPLQQFVTALVYISTTYTSDGPIRPEYVVRMRRAVADAVALGVPRGFVERCMVPYCGGGALLPLSRTGLSKQDGQSSSAADGETGRSREVSAVRRRRRKGGPSGEWRESSVAAFCMLDSAAG